MRKQRNIKFWYSLSVTIIVLTLGLTLFFIKHAKKVNFSGAVDDLIIIDKAYTEYLKSIGENEKIKENLVLMVSSDTLMSLSGLEDLKKITSELEKLPALDSVTSIAGVALPRSLPGNQLKSEIKNPAGLFYALRQAEITYSQKLKTPDNGPVFSPVFKSGSKPVFTGITPDNMKKAMFFIDNFSIWGEVPASLNDLKHFSKDSEHPIYLKNFISPDKKHCAILLTIADGWVKDQKALPLLRNKIEEFKKIFNNRYSFLLAGSMTLQEEMKKNIGIDTFSFIKIGLFLVLAAYFMAYRTLRGVVLPALALVISEIWVLGIMGLTGFDLNIVLYIVPVFVLAVGSSATIHVISRFYSNFSLGMDKIEASIQSVRALYTPIFMSSATTAFGFAALTISNVKGLNTFVLLTVCGLVIITVLSLLFIPALNILIPAPKDRKERSFIPGTCWKPFINFIIKNSAALKILFFILSVSAGLGIFLIDKDNDLTKLLKPDSETVKTSEIVSKNLAGTTIMNLVIQSMPGWPLKLENLRKLAEIQKEIENSPNIDKTTSIADIFKLTNYLRSMGQKEQQNLLPDTQLAVYSHLCLLSSMKHNPAYKQLGTALEDLINQFSGPDFSCVKIMLRSNITSLKVMNKEIERIKALCRKKFNTPVKVNITGGIVNLNKAVEKILFGQTQGVILALTTIFFLMLINFLSFKIAFICIIPNIFPILFFYGSLGLFKIGLDLSSGLVACVAIGIAVDDTIHFMTQLKKQLKKTYSSTEAIVESEKLVGSPILLTKLMLAILFGILIFSKFPVMSNLGWLQALTMLCCLTCNLVLLPAVLAGTRLVDIWDIMLQHDLDPRKASIFNGMSRFGIKSFISMGKISEFSKDDIIIKTGDPGEEMHIILEGTVKLTYPEISGENRQGSFILGPGQVFGELAVLSKTPRQSTARALTDIKTVSITKEFYKNAAAFHPRTCNKFLINVIDNLSMRLLSKENNQNP
jgi:predicted RND superfamily exporter protein